MVTLDELVPLVINLPSLEELKAAAERQIAVLNQQKTKLDGIATDLKALIERYNAQKSYLGHAAHWYGEQEWWLKLTVTIVAAGIGILLYIPAIISIALSLAFSFLLIDHYNVASTRDRLISEDLVAQNHSVETMLNLLNGTRENLEKGLKSLCKMNQDMGAENIRLRQNVDTVTRQVEEVKVMNTSLQATIKNFEANEKKLNLQLIAMSEELKKYEDMVGDSTRSFTTNNAVFQKTTNLMVENSKELSTYTEQLQQHLRQFPAMPGSAHSSTHSSPEDSLSKQGTANSAIALRNAQNLQKEIKDVDTSDDYLSALESQAQSLSPPRTKGHK
jgi:hypothetical protein